MLLPHRVRGAVMATGTLLAVFSLTIASHASQSAADRVDVALADVRVADKDGAPVTGLAAADFSATIDGKPATIVSFAAPPAARGPRTVMLLVDDLSARAEPLKSLLEPAEKMLSSLDAADLVGLATTSGLGPQVMPTRDRAAIVAALHRADLLGRADPRPAKPFVAVNEAYDMVRTGGDKDTGVRVVERECGGGSSGGAGGGRSRGGSGGSQGGGSADDSCASRVVAVARAVAAAHEALTRQQISAITTVDTKLAKVASAPRTLVVLTGGVALPLGASDAMDVVGRSAVDSQVALDGLVAIDDGDLANEASADRIKARHEEDAYEVAGLQTLAAASGGEAKRASTDGDQVLARMVGEAGAAYRVSVQTPAGTAMRYVPVKLTSTRTDLTLHATGSAVRPSVVASPVNPEAGRNRLQEGGTTFGVPIAVTTARRRDSSPTRVQLAVSVDVPAGTPAPVSAVFALIDGSGKVVQSGKKDLTQAPGDSYRLALPLPVEAGDYRLRVAVEDGHGNVASLDTVVSARLPKAGRLTTSDLMATSGSGDAPPHLLGLEMLPDHAQQLHVALEVYPETNDVSGIKVRLSIAPAAGGPAIVDGELPAALRDGRLVVSAALPVAVLKPDRYVITATVLDEGKPAGTLTTYVRKIG